MATRVTGRMGIEGVWLRWMLVCELFTGNCRAEMRRWRGRGSAFCYPVSRPALLSR